MRVVFQLYYFVRNMFYFMSKHAKKNSYLVFLPYFFLFEFPKKIVVILYKRRYKYLHYFLRGVIDGILLKTGAIELDS